MARRRRRSGSKRRKKNSIGRGPGSYKGLWADDYVRRQHQMARKKMRKKK